MGFRESPVQFCGAGFRPRVQGEGSWCRVSRTAYPEAHRPSGVIVVPAVPEVAVATATDSGSSSAAAGAAAGAVSAVVAVASSKSRSSDGSF